MANVYPVVFFVCAACVIMSIVSAITVYSTAELKLSPVVSLELTTPEKPVNKK